MTGKSPNTAIPLKQNRIKKILTYSVENLTNYIIWCFQVPYCFNYNYECTVLKHMLDTFEKMKILLRADSFCQ